LFWVQLFISKMVLPVLGGAAAVWNTCMVLFQLALLFGYGYAHLSQRWLGRRRQVFLHPAAAAGRGHRAAGVAWRHRAARERRQSRAVAARYPARPHRAAIPDSDRHGADAAGMVLAGRRAVVGRSLFSLCREQSRQPDRARTPIRH
jgi:hypothetical protein